MCLWYMNSFDCVINEHLTEDFIFSFAQVRHYTLEKITVYLVTYRVYYSPVFSFVLFFFQYYPFLLHSFVFDFRDLETFFLESKLYTYI